MALRHVLELGCGALVMPDQVAIRNAATAFDEADDLRDAGDAERAAQHACPIGGCRAYADAVIAQA